VVVLGRFFYVLLFLMAGPSHFFQANNRHCGFSRRAFGFDRVPLSGVLGLGRRPEHFLGYRAKTWRLAHCALPGSGNLMMHIVLAVQDPMMRRSHMGMFMKKMSPCSAAPC